MNVIIDFRASNDTIDALSKLNFNVIKTPELTSVNQAISGHSDIMIHKASEKELVCEPTVYDYFESKLPGYKIIPGEKKLKEKYPYDIAYNVCLISNKIFCNIPNTEKMILNRYEQMGFEIIHINQGYAKCSICIVSDNAIITSDKGIMTTAERNGIDVLLTNDDDIKLPGFNHGFIGGATGLISENKLAINGNIEMHRNSKQIIDFCSRYGVEVISLNKNAIVDIGSIIII